MKDTAPTTAACNADLSNLVICNRAAGKARLPPGHTVGRLPFDGLLRCSVAGVHG
jgi:hypothetical protein